MTPQRLRTLDLPALGESPPTKQQLSIAASAAGAIEKWPAEMTLMLQTLLGLCPADRWTPGAHALVWPSNRFLCDRTGFSLGQVQHWLGRLFDRQLIALMDDANGQRRNSLDPVTKAPRLPFGIRLSPLAHQLHQLEETIREHHEQRREADLLARNLGAQLRRIFAILDFILEDGNNDLAVALKDQTSAVANALRRLRRSHSNDLTGLGSLTRQADDLFEQARSITSSPESELVANTTPQAPADQTPYRTTNSRLASKDSVVAESATWATGREGAASKAQSVDSSGQEAFYPRPSLIARIAPTVGSLIYKDRPTEADIVDAAYQLLPPLGISQSAWSDACSNRGRYHAAVLVAVIAEKHLAQQVRSPGAYLRGMVQLDRAGQLNLDRSLFALRDRAARQATTPSSSTGALE
jgi:replication initiation protein RepC